MNSSIKTILRFVTEDATPAVAIKEKSQEK